MKQQNVCGHEAEWLDTWKPDGAPLCKLKRSDTKKYLIEVVFPPMVFLFHVVL